MLNQISLYAGSPFQAPCQSSPNGALPRPGDAHDQDDQRLLGRQDRQGDRGSILRYPNRSESHVSITTVLLRSMNDMFVTAPFIGWVPRRSITV
jgi:hypothetical protein